MATFNIFLNVSVKLTSPPFKYQPLFASVLSSMKLGLLPLLKKQVVLKTH